MQRTASCTQHCRAKLVIDAPHLSFSQAERAAHHLTRHDLQASGKLDLKEPYYRQLTQWPSDPQAWTAPHAAAAAGAAGTIVDESVFADAQLEDASGLLVAAEPASSAVQNAGTGYLF